MLAYNAARYLLVVLRELVESVLVFTLFIFGPFSSLSSTLLTCETENDLCLDYSHILDVASMKGVSSCWIWTCMSGLAVIEMQNTNYSHNIFASVDASWTFKMYTPKFLTNIALLFSHLGSLNGSY